MFLKLFPSPLVSLDIRLGPLSNCTVSDFGTCSRIALIGYVAFLAVQRILAAVFGYVAVAELVRL